MEMSSQLHAVAPLLLEREPLVPISYEDGWAPEQSWSGHWKRERLFSLLGINCSSCVVWPITWYYSAYSTLAPGLLV